MTSVTTSLLLAESSKTLLGLSPDVLTAGGFVLTGLGLVGELVCTRRSRRKYPEKTGGAIGFLILAALGMLVIFYGMGILR